MNQKLYLYTFARRLQYKIVLCICNKEKASKVASSLTKIASNNTTFKRQNTFLGLANVKSPYTSPCTY